MKKSKMLHGTVRWFDDASGEGMVRDSDGVNYMLHWSAIEGAETPANTENYDVRTKNWVTIEAGAPVRFTALSDDYVRMVQKLERV